MHKTKWKAVGLALAMLLAVLPGSATAETTEINWFNYLDWPEFHDGLAAVTKDGKWGFIDKSGTLVIPLELDYGGAFQEGVRWIYDPYDGLYGAIDRSGEIRIPFEYDGLADKGFQEGLAWVRKEEKWGAIDKTGNVVIPFEYDHSTHYLHGLAPVCKDGKWGYIDKTGGMVLSLADCEFLPEGQYIDGAEWFIDGLDGLARVSIRGSVGPNGYAFIDINGSLIIPPGPLLVFPFVEGLSAFEQNGKWGYMDKTGKIVIPCEYDETMFFSDGLARVLKKNKRGYIDQNGTVVFPIEFDYDGLYDALNEELVLGKKRGQLGIYDRNAEPVLLFDFEEVYYDADDGLFFIKKDGKWDIHPLILSDTNFIVDVPIGAWYEDAVKWAAENNVVDGDGKGNFNPTGIVTRGQLVTIICKAYGIEPAAGGDNFDDAGDTWYTGYLAAAKQRGIVSGVGGNLFNPEGVVTRAEMFTLLYNTLSKLDRLPVGDGPDLENFDDSGDIESWALSSMTYLVENGVISGSGGKLNPGGGSDRAQMVALLNNLA
jgi:hypothetical protein